MNLSWIHPLDPLTQKPLRFKAISEDAKFGYWLSDDGLQRWPVALGISFLRSDRHELAEQVASLIYTRDFVSALALLLTDTDDFAPQAPLLSDCAQIAQRLIEGDRDLSANEIMQVLKFGPVANYFSVRSSSPTFFSGLGLLKLGVTYGHPLVEIGCGVGHFLYWLNKRGIEALGTDTVFSKLCMANRYFDIKADHLVCAVAGKETPLPFVTIQNTNVFCHDVFYFIENKHRALDDFRRLAGASGSVMVGHAHLITADHGAVSGHPLSLKAYRQIALKNAIFFDDAFLVSLSETFIHAPQDISSTAEAIAFIEGNLSQGDIQWWNHPDEALFAPLEVTWSKNNCITTMNWPTEAFAKEYQSSKYLSSHQNPFEYLPFKGDCKLLPLHPGLAISAPSFAFGVSPLRWGIIGGGWIAKDYFVPAFEFAPHAKLVAISDIKSERCDAFSEIAGLKTFLDWREMLATCKLDAVYIATPNFLHAEIFEVVASFGIRILCEKPIATNQKDLDKIRACIHQRPTFFQTAFDQRYHPAHIQLARRIAAGHLGTVTQIRIHYACWLGDNWNKAFATENWRIDSSQAGGGAGFDLLPHCLDLILMLLDDSVVTSHLLYQSRVHEYATRQSIDDGAVLIVKTLKGTLASMHVGYNCPEDQPRRRIEIMGTLGRVDAYDTMGQDPGGELVWYINGEQTHETFSTSVEAGPFVRQLDAVTREWLRSDNPQFPIERDLLLAQCLIQCDHEAKKKPTFQVIPS